MAVTTMNQFHLIIKNPQSSLTDVRRVLPATLSIIEKTAQKLNTSIGEFIDRVYDLQPNDVQIPESNRVQYSGSYLHQNNELKVGLTGTAAQYNIFCRLIHSVKAMNDGIAKIVSNDGIFGLSPVLESTSFAVAWIRSFLGSVIRNAGAHLETIHKMQSMKGIMSSCAVALYTAAGAVVQGLLANAEGENSVETQLLITLTTNEQLDAESLQKYLVAMIPIFKALYIMCFPSENRQNTRNQINSLTSTIDNVTTRYSEFIDQHMTVAHDIIGQQKGEELFISLYHTSKTLGDFLLSSKSHYEEYVNSLIVYTGGVGLAGCLAVGMMKAATPGPLAIAGGAIGLLGAVGSVICMNENRRVIKKVIDRTLAVNRLCVVTYVTIALYYEQDSCNAISQEVSEMRATLENVRTILGHASSEQAPRHERFRQTMIQYYQELKDFDTSVKAGLLKDI